MSWYWDVDEGDNDGCYKDNSDDDNDDYWQWDST